MDPDPTCPFDADPDPAFQFDLDPDWTFWSGSLPFQSGYLPKTGFYTS
jgi:hypothetical protein